MTDPEWRQELLGQFTGPPGWIKPKTAAFWDDPWRGVRHQCLIRQFPNDGLGRVEIQYSLMGKPITRWVGWEELKTA